ncbi:hypothetical protein V5H98_16405 [Georgenia sp. M64]|uniref:hypothetical protein n=1 Tax=Georgenia sp. M64 TaxID=3120520 RepID=UPI0030E0E3A5
MFNRKKFAGLASTAAVGLALVGVGTGAQWADSVDAVEDLTTGTADLQIIDAYALSGAPESIVIAADGDSVTFTTPLEDGSFSYIQDVIIQNVGSLPMKAAWYEVDVAGDLELTDNVIMRLNDVRDAADGVNGPASGSHLYKSPGYAMPAGSTTTLWFDFWTDTVLPDAAQGKSMTVTVTFHGVDGDGGTPMLEIPEVRS